LEGGFPLLRKLIPALALALTAALVLQPMGGDAASSQLDKINQQIKQLQQEMNRKAELKKQAEKNAEIYKNQKEATKEEIDALVKLIDEAGTKLAKTQEQVEQTEEKLRQTGLELEDAIQREESTSAKLDNRVRLMYTNGAVSYLDVLLSATNFTDFISRFDQFQSIATSTKELLEDQKAARALVEEKKEQVARDLDEVKALYDQIASQKADLEAKESQKEAMVAKLSQQIEDSEEISEESERELMELAKKMSKLQAEKNKIQNPYKGGKLAMPLKASYRLSSPFGNRTHPISGVKKLHTGIDMAVAQGTPIYAAEGGVVIVAQWWSGYGNCIIIDHGGGLWTLYGHIKNGGILVNKGDTVKRGEKIALVGSTGQATGPHLHFEVRKNSEPVDPAPYLK
jgi:murein DD-endopeptidase MepM/ murein hydrolase activator NlpD